MLARTLYLFGILVATRLISAEDKPTESKLDIVFEESTGYLNRVGDHLERIYGPQTLHVNWTQSDITNSVTNPLEQFFTVPDKDDPSFRYEFECTAKPGILSKDTAKYTFTRSSIGDDAVHINPLIEFGAVASLSCVIIEKTETSSGGPPGVDCGMSRGC